MEPTSRIPTDRSLHGSCLCGAVQYSVPDAFKYALNCHCSQCRRATGSAFKAFAGIERNKLHVNRGGDNLLIFGDSNNHDARCKTCGSLLFSIVRDGKYAHVTLGTLLDSPTMRPSAHIFVESKASCYAITDDLPQHVGFG